MTFFKGLCRVIVCCCCVQMLQAQETGKTKNPLRITGNIGASANFYSSNDSFYTRPPYALNIYGGLTAHLKNFTMPVSFVVNKYDQSRTTTFSQWGIIPTYKWIKVHIGYRNLPFSPLTYEGQSFRGVGLELRPKGFRFAAFYGTFNKALNGGDTVSRFKGEPSHGSLLLPQYARKAYGVKIGIGSSNNFFDLIYFHAKDDINSASFTNNSVFKTDSVKNIVSAKENTVIGASFRIKFIRRLALSGDVAVSGLTQNIQAERINIDSAFQYVQLAKVVNRLLPFNLSSIVSFAGQSSLSYSSNTFSSVVNYRNVRPDFISLGTPYILNDVEQLSWLNNIMAIKGRVNLSTNLSYQHNDLSKKLTTELKTFIATANMNAYISQHVNLNVNYAGYNLQQDNQVVKLNGTPVKFVNDTFLLHQNISQYTVTPSYNFTRGVYTHFISYSTNLSVLKDKNTSTSAQTNSTNISSSLNYALGFTNRPFGFSLGGLYNIYKQKISTYTSYGLTLGASLHVLKEKNLNFQGSAGYMINNYSNTGSQNKSNNLTYSLDISYYAKHHSFSLFANYVYIPPNAIQKTINKLFPYTVVSNNLYSGISYNYSF